MVVVDLQEGNEKQKQKLQRHWAVEITGAKKNNLDEGDYNANPNLGVVTGFRGRDLFSSLIGRCPSPCWWNLQSKIWRRQPI